MVDPLSVSSLAITVVGICTTILGYVNAIQTTDACLYTLGVEISHLSNVIESLCKQFENPAVRKRILSKNPATEIYWQHVKRAMYDCGRTLESLERVLAGLKRGHGNGPIAFAYRAGTRIKLGQQAAEIDLYKRQIVSYREAMKLALHVISVYVPIFDAVKDWLTDTCRFTGQRIEERVAEVFSKLEDMARDISSILQRLPEASQSAIVGTPRSAFENLQTCLESAHSMVCIASAKSHDPIDATPGHSIELKDPEIKSLWYHGKTEFDSENYDDAEEYLEMAYEKSEAYGSMIRGWEKLMVMLVISHCKRNHFEEADKMVMNLVKARVTAEPIMLAVEGKIFELADILVAKYAEAGKWDDALRVVTEIIEIKKQYGVSFYDSQRTLAETYLKMGDIEKAKTQCPDPKKDPKEMWIRNPPHVYYESALLMVLICQSKKEKALAVCYDAILPEDYKGWPDC